MEQETFTVTDFDILRRFLVCGRQDGLYVVTPNNESITNGHFPYACTQSIHRLIMDGRGKDVVDEICRFSCEGRVPKQGPLLYALAICARCNDIPTKNAAYRSLSSVCHIPTHLFQFVQFTEMLSGESSGWGRAQRKAISKWYNQQKFKENPMQLLRLGSKYKRRHKFSHKDVLRLGHVTPETDHLGFAFCYFAKGEEGVRTFPSSDDVIQNAYDFVKDLEATKKCSVNDVNQLCNLIRKHDLSREHIPTPMLNSPEIWKTLIYTMPLNALIRHLGKLSKLGLLSGGSLVEHHVIERLKNKERLRIAKVHPLTLLTAWNNYQKGHSGPRRRMEWEINDGIVNSLEDSFYISLANVESTGKKILIAVDGSETMLQNVSGMQDISARSVAVAMTFILSKIETEVEIVLVKDDIDEIVLEQTDNLESASHKFSIGGTHAVSCNHCLPIDWARKRGKKFEAVIFFTTSTVTTSIGRSIGRFRRDLGLPHARLVVVAMDDNIYATSDANDLNTLTVVGLDVKAVKLILDFVSGQ